MLTTASGADTFASGKVGGVGVANVCFVVNWSLCVKRTCVRGVRSFGDWASAEARGGEVTIYRRGRYAHLWLGWWL